jgi:hypothetical protein
VTILFQSDTFVNSNPYFGRGILPEESARDAHFRESMDVCDAVAQRRAIRIPLDSPRYAAFVEAMNECEPVATDADEAWRTEQLAREEFEAWLDHVYQRELDAEVALMRMG